MNQDRALLFAMAYWEDPTDPTGAAIKVGYSPKGAKQRAWHLLRHPKVIKYLDERREEAKKKTDITAERVIQELAAIAFANIKDYYKVDKNGKRTLKNLEELTEEQAAAISEIDYKTGKLKGHDKIASLGWLGKRFKLFTELHETQHTFTQMGRVTLNGVPLDFNVGEPK